MLQDNDRYLQEVEEEFMKTTSFKHIPIPATYKGPELTFPLTQNHITELIDAYKKKQVTFIVSPYNLK